MDFVDAPDNAEELVEGEFSLPSACFLGRLDIVKEYLVEGVDVNIKSHHYDNEPAIYEAVHYNNKDSYEITELLLRHGADPNTTTRCGDNALNRCISIGNYLKVKLLVEYGADPFFVDKVGDSVSTYWQFSGFNTPKQDAEIDEDAAICIARMLNKRGVDLSRRSTHQLSMVAKLGDCTGFVRMKEFLVSIGYTLEPEEGELLYV